MLCFKTFPGLNDLFSLLSSNCICEGKKTLQTGSFTPNCMLSFFTVIIRFTLTTKTFTHSWDKQRGIYDLNPWTDRKKNAAVTHPVDVKMTRTFLCLSQRSLTKQRRGRCSKCLKSSTKSCTRGEALEPGSSRGCRMNVSSGPLASLISGTFPSVPPTFWLFLVVVLFTVGVCQDRGDSGGASRWRGLPVVRYSREEQLGEQHVSSQRQQHAEPTER